MVQSKLSYRVRSKGLMSSDRFVGFGNNGGKVEFFELG